MSALLIAATFTASPAPARAADGTGCPTLTRTWFSPGRRCNFSVKGFPVVFSGSVTKATSGLNWIRVWVSPRGYPDVVLAECRATGSLPRCGGGLPDSSTVLDLIPQSAERPSFDCNVQGSSGTEGTFYCQSGSNL